MPLILRPAQEADVPAICDVFFSAFAKDLVMSATYPDIPSVRTFFADLLRADIPDPTCHIMCIVNTDLPDSLVIAYAKWEACDENTRQTGPLCPEGGDMSIAEMFFPRLRQRKLEIMAGKKYWYLGCLCCHADHQGMGAGGMLLRFGIELADKDGKEMYVEASPPGAPVYKKYGWVEQDRVVLLDGRFTELLMKRDARKI